MMADCWRCATTIELTEEQERQVEQLLAARDQHPTPPPVPQPGPNLVPVHQEISGKPPEPGAGLLPANESGEFLREPWLRHLLNETPAWLISMLVHMIVFTLLALLTMEEKPAHEPFITLSAV